MNINLAFGLNPRSAIAMDSNFLRIRFHDGTGTTAAYTKRIGGGHAKQALKLSLYTTKRRILAFRLRARWRGDTKDVKYLTKNSPCPRF